MGKVVVTEFITLDGVIEDPGGAEKFEHGGWAFRFDTGEEGGKYKFDELQASDAQLLGRVTYEGFAKAWPKMEDAGEFGIKMNEMPKFVVSSTIENPNWNNSTVIGGDLGAAVARLKEQFAGDILVAGSAQLVNGLIARGLVDELHLIVYPVVLGSGKRLFADGAELASFSLTDSTRLGDAALLTLVPKR
jgi:dihydrofolate reductase